jgi:hypothetical protein
MNKAEDTKTMKIEDKKQENTSQNRPDDTGNVNVEGHIKIFDPESGEVFVDKRNAIHYENMSEALALSIGNKTTGFIHELALGNGGTSVDPTGVITYKPANSTGTNSSLYNQTYYKVVDDLSALNNDANRNKITVNHTEGAVYTDIVVNCLLDYGEPSGQSAFDNTNNFDGTFVFDELGLKSWAGTVNTGKLLTHVVFHPVQKSLNRLIEIEYTVRIQTLTNLSTVN